MKKTIIQYLSFLWLILLSQQVQARDPISAALQIAPPYSVYLQDYASAVTEPMKVQVTLLDMQQPFYDVRLHLKIEGPGITIETSPFYNPPPITLEPGSRQSLSGAQLYEMLMAENLDFKGLSRAEFERSGGALPEGFYRFSISVRDYRRPDVVLSNQATAMVWLTLGDPPLLNQPHCGTEIKLNEGMQNLIFQWTPLNAGSPYALTTEYVFTLVEIRVPGFNPNDAINSLPPIYEVTTNQTSILYGPAEPPLIPGLEYVWRVQAVDMQGRDVFKNNGYSNICAFRITEDVSLLSPSDLAAEAESDRRARVTWSLMPEVESYRIEYRKADMEDAAWFGQDSEEGEIIINNLEPETTYEVRAGSKRGNYTSSWGQSVTFTTDAAREFICGQDPSLGEIENKNPLKSAMVGDVFKVGHFEVRVQQIEGSNGTFSGMGYITMPFLFVKIGVKFDNISVNENQQVYAGKVNAISEGIEAFLKRIEEERGPPGGNGGDDFDGVEETIDGVMDSVYINDEGRIVVITTEGDEVIVDAATDPETGESKEVRITDSENNQVVVADGQVGDIIPPGSPGNNLDPVSPDASELQLMAKFSPSAKQLYGFDSLSHQAIKDIYPTYQVEGHQYRAAWKSVKENTPDKVRVTIKGKSKEDYEKIKFKTLQETPVPAATVGDNLQELTINGSMAEMEHHITAYLEQENEDGETEQVPVGQLNIASYQPQPMQVVLVPVNDATINANLVANYLNETYKQAVTSWQVIDGDDYQVNQEVLNALDEGESGLLASFPRNMRQFIRDYKRNIENYDKDAYYVFIIEGANANRAGFMPFKRQFGFVFQNKTANLERTIAHELGHGAFRLRHTFSSKDFIAEPGDTKNLMDYSQGNHLHKQQWDYIHNPQAVIGWFEDDEEGEYISESKSQEMARFINYIKCARSKGESTIEIHHGWNLYEVTVGSIISNLDYKNTGSIISEDLKDAKLRATISRGYGSEPRDVFLGYKDLYLNLTQIDYNVNSKLFIKANIGGILFSTPFGTDEALREKVFNWLRRECGLTGQPTPINVNNQSVLKADDIFLFSKCEFEQINRITREKLIIELLQEQENWAGLDKDTYQYLLINLLKTIPGPDKDYFFTLFKKSPQWLSYLYENMASAQIDKLMKIFIELWYNHYKGNIASVKSEASKAFVVTNSIFGNAKNYLHFSEQGEVVFTTPQTQVTEFIAIETNEELFHAKAFEPIYFGTEGDKSNKPFTVLPAFCIKYYTDKGNMENMKESLMLTANVALFAVGVGEVVAGVRGAILLARTTGVASTKFLGSSLRISLGIADLVASISSGYCGVGGNSGSDFCQTWKEYEFFISMGLLTASVGDMLYTKLSRNYTPNVKRNLNGDQIDFIEGDLGILVRTGRYIAKTGEELKIYLNSLTDLPKGVSYNGNLFRSLTAESQTKYGIVAEKMTDHTVYSSWGRYDLDEAENAMYLSITEAGNKTEVLYYVNDWNKWNTYEFVNVRVENLLDLTNNAVRQNLGILFDDLVRTFTMATERLTKAENYEMTNVIASWARKKGYNGIKAPGARGAQDYINIILFDQKYIDDILEGITTTKLKKSNE